MQARPTRPSTTFEALEVSLLAIETLRPLATRLRGVDRDIADQLRRALSSVSLNLAEGHGSRGGNRVARFSTALGSVREARAALHVAIAWGYLSADEIVEGDDLLDRVAAMLHRLGARR